MPFTKGVPNINRKGQPPKEWTMSGLIRSAAEEEDETGIPKKKIIARKLANLAVKGDMAAMKEFNNRVDGMSVQKIGGDEYNPIKIDVGGVLDRVYGKK